MTFEDFYKELTSDERWFEQASMHYKPETFELKEYNYVI